MNRQVFSRPDAEDDVIEIAAWYESRAKGLGHRFVKEFLAVLDQLAVNPLLHCRRHPRKNIRWRYPQSFPYRVIYDVDEQERIVVVAAVLHASRREREWKRRDLLTTFRLTGD